MRVLVLGGGGREHALCWRLGQTAEVFCAPGNPGIAEVGELIKIDSEDGAAVSSACKALAIDLVVIGPERQLFAGVADVVRARGTMVYGPSERCARIESSKAFAKAFMSEVGIPTAIYETFTDFSSAKKYIEESAGPLVVKASGEALGKGAIVCETAQEAIDAAAEMLVEGKLGEAGKTIVVEERLRGREVSLMAICSGTDYRLLPPARDYKAVFDGGGGPNTGGMGAVSPVDVDDLDKLGEALVGPVLKKFADDGTPFRGTLYPGLMLTSHGPKVLEYNARFGDPEAQAILPRIRGDFAEILHAAATGRALPEVEVSSDACVTVVIASQGYPRDYQRGVELPDLAGLEGLSVFHSGTKFSGGKLVSNGGRVLALTACGPDANLARDKIYSQIRRFEGGSWHFRRDIGT